MVSDHAGALIRPDGTRRHVAIHYDRQSGQSEILYRFQRVRRRALHQVRTRRYRMGTPLAIETGEARHDQASPSGLHEHFAHQEDAPDARMQAENWLNSLNAGCDHCIAQGNRADLNCGEVLSLRFPDDTRSDWLITGLTQQIAHPQVLEELASDSFRHYQTLTAVPDTQTWRPPRQTPRRLTGFWPAIVTGPEPGKVFTDDQGRVQVRFAWDPDGQPGTWLRVSQRLAGNRWGSLMLPRAGDEVSVLFLEGNPDTPVVAGRRYHSAHEAPQSLPDGQHQWMFRSRSADGTGHEVLLDDSPGNAHILLHSSGQLALRARKRYQASVQGSVHQKVAGHLQETTDGASSEQADGNWNEHVSGQTHLQAGQSLVLGGQSLTLEAGGSIHLKGGNALLNSGQTVIFKVGGAAVSCGPGGVSLSAPVVMVNMGGGGGAAATASPAAPEKSPAVPPQRGALRTRLRPLAGQSGDAAHIQRLTPLTTGSGSAPATSRPEPPVPSAVLGASTLCQAPRQVQSGVNMSAIAPQSSSEDAKTFAHSLRYTPPATGNNSASPDPVSPGYVFTGELAVDALPEDARFELSTGDGKWTSVCTLERVRQYGRVYEIPFDGKPPYEPLHLYICSDSMTSARHYLRTVIPDKNHRTTQDN